MERHLIQGMRGFCAAAAMGACILATGPGFAQDTAAPSAGDTAADSAPKDTGNSFDDALSGAKEMGHGPAQIYQKDGSTLISITPGVFDRLLLWYGEIVAMPVEVTSESGNALGETIVRLERRGNTVFVRDLIGTAEKRSGRREMPRGPRTMPLDTTKIDPIDVAVSKASLGPILMAFEIVAEHEDGRILIDATDAFSNDLGGKLSALPMIATAEFTPIGTDPQRSYVESARSFPENMSIRSHLTYTDPNGAAASVVVGHSIVLLPDTPRQARRFNPKVGYFEASFLEFEGKSPVSEVGYILRQPLEKADPSIEGPSDPVQPLVYYIGRGVPDRWRPYIKEAVEMWAPALEGAGFTNAIVARDAPSPEDDPDWSPEDARHNVIRWLPQDVTNAMGPAVYDPRSGEIMSSHILLWPSVLDYFGTYYFLLHNTVDPEAARLPLPEEKLGELLRYVVAHEVGHTLGLRHNHLASTAYTIAQQRDAAFSNVNGPNASIMAYGRFNQAAQPGDGVTQFYPVIGPWDKFAIEWGYRQFDGLSAEEERQMLDDMATAAAQERTTAWAAGEKPEESRSNMDPRVQMENTGADRVEATRLAGLRIAAMLERLPEATGGDLDLIRKVYDQALSRYGSMLLSVHRMIGGVYDEQSETPRYNIVAKGDQRRAVNFLLREAPEILTMFDDQRLTMNLEPVGSLLTVDGYREMGIRLLLVGSRLALLDSQKRADPAAYGVVDFADDFRDALFSELDDPDHNQRLMQSAFIDTAGPIINAPVDNRAIGTLVSQLFGQDPDMLQITNSKGSGTLFPSWARREFPVLKARVEAAAEAANDVDVQLHYQRLARQIDAALNPPVGAAAPAGALE